MAPREQQQGGGSGGGAADPESDIEEERQRRARWRLFSSFGRLRSNVTFQVARVGTDVCHIESLAYELIENDVFKQDWRAQGLLKAKNCSTLLENDQLVSEFSTGRLFEGFQEGSVTFSPTYKYQPNSDQYYWCFEAARGRRSMLPHGVIAFFGVGRT